jgi:hypothetical protein
MPINHGSKVNAEQDHRRLNAKYGTQNYKLDSLKLLNFFKNVNDWRSDQSTSPISNTSDISESVLGLHGKFLLWRYGKIASLPMNIPKNRNHICPIPTKSVHGVKRKLRLWSHNSEDLL